MIRKGPPKNGGPRGGGPASSCSFVRLLTVGLFVVSAVWLSAGIVMFRAASKADQEQVQAQLRATEDAVARKLRAAEAAVFAAARSRQTSAVAREDPEPPPEPVPPGEKLEGDDQTANHHKQMGHDFGSAAAAASHATPPPSRGPPGAEASSTSHAVAPAAQAAAPAAPAASAARAAAPAARAAETIASKFLSPAAATFEEGIRSAGGSPTGWDQQEYNGLIWDSSMGERALPPFWEPPAGVDLDSSGSYVNNQPTIFLMVASYRDFQCRDTVSSALSRAAHAFRVAVAVVEQNAYGPGTEDQSCVEPHKPCAQDPEQPLCKYAHQIRLFKVDSKSATGPVFARHVGDRMYRGEYYAMQLDAHVTFIKDWDLLMISQFHETKNDYALLSTYLTDVQGSIDAQGRSKRRTRPIMCNSHFEGGGQTSHLRHLAQPEEVAVMQDTPMLEPFWAAGMSFSRGHFVVRVPYDCCLPMLFQGEEISIGIRAWTFGYDMYAPHTSVIFHEYAVNSARRRGVHAFWENRAAVDAAAGMRRMVGLIKMAPDLSPASYDHKDEFRYGLAPLTPEQERKAGLGSKGPAPGLARPVELFYKLFGMDTRKKTMVPELCKFVKSGKMHEAFSNSLRPNGKGIDYSVHEDFDIKAALDEILTKLSRGAEDLLRAAIAKKKIPALQNSLEMANRAKRVNPKLLAEANALLSELKRV